MKKAAILTFHAAHNYGSMLQAYALQRVVSELGMPCEILNFRTPRQREMYKVFTKRRGLKYFLKNATRFLHRKPLCEKYARFEGFLKENLHTSEKEYESLQQLEAAELDYDYYISGSDQIWNPVPKDFDWAYYLPFAGNAKRIAYAPSMGPLGAMGDVETQMQIAQHLAKYDSISVRENSTKRNVEKLIGKNALVVLDPTLLLSKAQWEKLIQQGRIIEEDYIFLYTLFANPEIMEIAKRFSKAYHLPVVVSNFTNQYDVISPFRKKLHVGPLEFLNLIQNAKLVLASSFHGTAFAIKLQKPFFAIGGAKDARISTLLETAGLENRAIDLTDMEQKLPKAFDISFDEAQARLGKKIEESITYLRKALELDGNL